MNVKNLQVKTVYQVGLGDVEIPENVLEQLKEMEESGDTFSDMNEKYADAIEWMDANIKESDCFEWSYEVIEVQSPV